MRWNAPLCAAAMLLVSAGCTSFSSTVLSRLDDGSYVGESNGKPAAMGQARPFKGIPITLKVPTHLDVFIDEVYFVKLEQKRAVEILDRKTRLLQVRTAIVNSDKVFTVDFKRPASGFLDLDITFEEEEQYFKKIVSQLQDDTITDTANLVGTVIKSFAGVSASTETLSPGLESALAGAQIERDIRVVAFKRFDINSPFFEEEVECFVNLHLNNCNRCGMRPDYDSLHLIDDAVPPVVGIQQFHHASE